MPKKDLSQLAKSIVDQATGEAESNKPLTGKKADSSKGGLKGGKTRMEQLSSELAKKAAACL